MNINLTLDSSYKKAIQLAGVKAIINNIDTKVLIKNENAEYGIDYKKIISSTTFKQGDYVFIDGVQYLIVDIDEQMSQSVYNVGAFRKAEEIILLGSTNKTLKAIVDRSKVSIMTSSTIQAEYDQYNFIIPKLGNNVALNSEIVWDGGIYTVISVDTTKYGLYYVTGKYKDTYVPHTYTISLADTSETLQDTETYQIVATCCDNGTTVTNPTITYTSTDPNIVSVDTTGLVNCKGVGSVTITCTYQGVNANLSINVEEKPSEPVISYTTNWSHSITELKQYMTTALTTGRTVNGVDDSTFHIDYSFDSNAQSLISAGKIVVKRKSDSSITIKNTSVNSKTNIYLTVTDKSTGTKILDAQKITLTGM